MKSLHFFCQVLKHNVSIPIQSIKRILMLSKDGVVYEYHFEIDYHVVFVPGQLSGKMNTQIVAVTSVSKANESIKSQLQLAKLVV